MSAESRDPSCYFAGQKLFGDDFTRAEIEEWFVDERLGYYQLAANAREKYRYAYHALNVFHGFRHLPNKTYSRVLGVGSAFADELLPIVSKISHITVLEPAPAFAIRKLAGVPVEYIEPSATGVFPFAEAHFELVTCLGVLHHIPNVSAIVREMYRCTTPGGYLLLREPLISMGDWRYPRKGLTKRERGIPAKILRDIIGAAGFQIVRERKCVFPLTVRLRYLMKSPVYNSRLCVLFDAAICNLPIWPYRYHATRFWHKLRPSAIFYVLKKPHTQVAKTPQEGGM
jgi:SAM-dependent methyltransferase